MAPLHVTRGGAAEAPGGGGDEAGGSGKKGEDEDDVRTDRLDGFVAAPDSLSGRVFDVVDVTVYMLLLN